jgi:hypothetical protein
LSFVVALKLAVPAEPSDVTSKYGKLKQTLSQEGTGTGLEYPRGFLSHQGVLIKGIGLELVMGRARVV